MGHSPPPASTFAGRAAAARQAQGPLVLGLDPSPEVLERWGLGDTPTGLERFVDITVQAAVASVGFAKPQAAFYERHGWEGMRALQRLITELRSAGVLVIVDAKRGDVGSTNEAYADAYLDATGPFAGDALTVHPYLGLGAMEAFFRRAARYGRGLFVVTRSSNPEGRVLQTARTSTGLSVEAQLLAEIGKWNALLAPPPSYLEAGGRADATGPGDRRPLEPAAAAAPDEGHRLGPVGAVIGPTHGGLPDLDLLLANGLFLAPGLGAQGATVADVAGTFASCPERVLPSASRSLLNEGPDPARLAEAATRLGGELRQALSPPPDAGP